MKLLVPSPALLAASLTLIIIACNHPAEKVSPNRNEFKTPATSDGSLQFAAADTTAAPLQDKQPSPTTTSGSKKEDWDKKIIKTATLAVEVKNYKAFNDMFRSGIKQLGGYVAQEEQNQDEYKIENNLVIKVPADQFDNAVAQLTPVGEKINEKKISSEDVTGEIVDTKSRMEAKKKVRDRYMDLLKQAKNMEEILQVQNEINDIQEQIESAAGRVAYLGHSSAYSTINLRFYQVLDPARVIHDEPSFGNRIVDSFASGLKWLGELLVLLISLWPLWTGVIMLWLIIRRYKPAAAKNVK